MLAYANTYINMRGNIITSARYFWAKLEAKASGAQQKWHKLQSLQVVLHLHCGLQTKTPKKKWHKASPKLKQNKSKGTHTHKHTSCCCECVQLGEQAKISFIHQYGWYCCSGLNQIGGYKQKKKTHDTYKYVSLPKVCYARRHMWA